MRVEIQAGTDPGITKIKALLLAARADLAGNVRELAQSARELPKAPGDPVPDRSAPIERLRKKVGVLRGKIEGIAVQGAANLDTRKLVVRALLETDQALATLAASYSAPDQSSAIALLVESTRLMKEANSTSSSAGSALGIPWPLQ